MKLRSLGSILTGVCLAAVVACAPSPTQPSSENPQDSQLEEEVASDTGNESAEAQDYSFQTSEPETKMAQVSVEGETSEIELQRFVSESSPFMTYFPAEDFTPEAAGEGSEEGDRFYFSPTGTPNREAYVQVVFPENASSPEDVQQLVLGDKGLLAINNWDEVSQNSSTAYSWAVEEIFYEQNTDAETYMGVVYIGEQNGEAFYVVTHAPAEYGDGFDPRANMILENLEISDTNSL
ncbi:MAG: hypothetical protein HC840_09905 [Leptolyngbyaceae cyanobacterium RM2_2_4]|nr:hypothetical protein [Leptolyngbyaceae cyanobacterium SM1_4_3]NJO49697.1 hypothetical protein [Leptolyngbyaceae cyanobacterium RM2_2_4]